MHAKSPAAILSARSIALAIAIAIAIAGASTSLPAQPVWQQRLSLGWRASHAMAYDATRGRTVLYGGYQLNLNGASLTTETWESDGVDWTRVATVGPPPYATKAMAFDRLRSRSVVLVREDTWEWDGVQWVVHRSPSMRPSSRDGFALAYDAVRGRTVLFGGASTVPPGELFNDTWEWDGTTWTEVVPPTRPNPRRGHVMVFDSTRQRVLLFGGVVKTGATTTSAMADTWQWDGSDWTHLDPLLHPPPRESSVLTYDAGRQRAVLFGGVDRRSGSVVLGDTWEWDGVAWAQRFPATAPSGRYDAGLVYDERAGQVVLFGGWWASNLEQGWETWSWDGTNWRSTGSGPPPTRLSAAMAFDSTHQCCLLFGGYGLPSALADTWAWDGSRWSQRHPVSSPPARRDHAMVEDPGRGRIVLFGGTPAFGSFGDTWEWDGSEWEQRLPAAAPAARHEHAMVYDAGRQRVLLFGGSPQPFANQPMNDTWEWDGTSWLQRFPSVSPAVREGHGLAYDQDRQRVVLFGGLGPGTTGNLADTWEWDGTNWTFRNPATIPPRSEVRGLVYDTARRRVVLYGFGLWEWDGTNWTALPSGSVNPGYPSTPAVAYDGARQRLVAFTHPLGETWLFGNIVPASASEYGAGCAGTSGVPVLGSFGLPVLGNARFAVDVLSARPASGLALLLAGSPASYPLGGGCTLLVDPLAPLVMLPGASNLGGFASFPLAIPSGIAVGSGVYAQAAILDPLGGALGVALTGGLALILGE